MTPEHDSRDPGHRRPVPGVLYIVPTPIGHPDDISIRAVNTLRQADLIAAEDTRIAGRLLGRHDIRSRLISCHEHNEAGRVDGLIQRLESGESVALITDAGTPCVSDPGYRLVAAAADAGIRVCPLPGPSAAVCALSASGLPSDAFAFSGFPPRKRQRRRDWLRRLATASETRIFYESPRRVIRFLDELREIFGDRRMAAARELTKTWEEILRGRISEIHAVLAARDAVKGEFTLVVEGRTDGFSAELEADENRTRNLADDNAPSVTHTEADSSVPETVANLPAAVNMADLMDRELREALSSGKEKLSGLSRRIARKFGRSRREVYAAAVIIQKEKQNK